MPKRTKKPDPKPTPPAADITVDKSETLAHDSKVVAEFKDGRVFIAHDDSPSPILRSKDTCPICGTARTAGVCPVDGFRFEGATK